MTVTISGSPANNRCARPSGGVLGSKKPVSLLAVLRRAGLWCSGLRASCLTARIFVWPVATFLLVDIRSLLFSQRQDCSSRRAQCVSRLHRTVRKSASIIRSGLCGQWCFARQPISRWKTACAFGQPDRCACRMCPVHSQGRARRPDPDPGSRHRTPSSPRRFAH